MYSVLLVGMPVSTWSQIEADTVRVTSSSGGTSNGSGGRMRKYSCPKATTEYCQSAGMSWNCQNDRITEPSLVVYWLAIVLLKARSRTLCLSRV